MEQLFHRRNLRLVSDVINLLFKPKYILPYLPFAVFDLSSILNKYPNNNRPYYGYPGSGLGPSYGGYPTGGFPNNFYPNSGYPGAGYPMTGGGYPSGIYPGGYPNVVGGGAGYPSYGTNMLGTGNGGYGGFGGNGGLPTYYGYNSNNYYGNRNNGFGYYKDTSAEGLSRSADIRDGSHGHRGYN